MRTALPLTLILLLALGAGWLWFGWGPEGHRSPEPATPAGGDFTLQSSEGPVSLESLRGQVVLLYFGYTWCPDICPTNLGMMSGAFSMMDEEALEQVQGIFVSVDPERDSLERLATYTSYFHDNIIGITGTPEAVAAVADQYGVAYRKVESDSETGYVVDHSSATYVIDQMGKLHTILPHATPPDKILATVRQLLAEQPEDSTWK